MDRAAYAEQAKSYYEQALERVRTTPAPEGQKFPCGARVQIAKELGAYMRHFPNDTSATVLYTYAHAYGGKDVECYCLDVDGQGSTSWYEEWQLSLK